MNTKQDFINTIKTIAEANGFKTEESNLIPGVQIVDFNEFGDEHFVNFSIVAGDHSYDLPNRSITLSFTITASCSSMGGDPTSADLRRQADALTRAANLVDMAAAYAKCGLLTFTQQF